MQLKNFTISIICLLLVACGGGDGSSSSPSNGTTSPASAHGIWGGTYTTDTGLQFLSSALITSNGKVGIDLGNGIIFIGTADTNGNVITIVGHESEATSALITISGNVASQQTLSAIVTQGAYAIDVNDRFDFTYDSIYEKNSSLEKLTSTWFGQQYFTSGSVLQNWSITIASDGTFTGSADKSINDFSLNGSFNIIDANKNEYQVTMTINDPGAPYHINGDYTGIATLLDSSTVDDTLWMFLECQKTSYKVIGRLKLQRS